MSNSTEMRATAHPPVPAARRTTGQRDDRVVPPSGALAPNSPAAVTAAGASSGEPSGFPVKPKTRTYSAAWKADCLAYVQAELAKGRALYAICLPLQIYDATVSVWMREAGIPLPRVSVKAATARAASASAAARAASGTSRACLGCRRTFRSQGPHNRLCDNCRRRDSSPYEPNPGGHTGTRVGAKR